MATTPHNSGKKKLSSHQSPSFHLMDLEEACCFNTTTPRLAAVASSIRWVSDNFFTVELMTRIPSATKKRVFQVGADGSPLTSPSRLALGNSLSDYLHRPVIIGIELSGVTVNPLIPNVHEWVGRVLTDLIENCAFTTTATPPKSTTAGTPTRTPTTTTKKPLPITVLAEHFSRFPLSGKGDLLFPIRKATSHNASIPNDADHHHHRHGVSTTSNAIQYASLQAELVRRGIAQIVMARYPNMRHVQLAAAAVERQNEKECDGSLCRSQMPPLPPVILNKHITFEGIVLNVLRGDVFVVQVTTNVKTNPSSSSYSDAKRSNPKTCSSRAGTEDEDIEVDSDYDEEAALWPRVNSESPHIAVVHLASVRCPNAFDNPLYAPADRLEGQTAALIGKALQRQQQQQRQASTDDGEENNNNDDNSGAAGQRAAATASAPSPPHPTCVTGMPYDGFSAMRLSQQTFLGARVRCCCISFVPSDKDLSNNTQEGSYEQQEHFVGTVDVLLPSGGGDGSKNTSSSHQQQLLSFYHELQREEEGRLHAAMACQTATTPKPKEKAASVSIAFVLFDLGLGKLLAAPEPLPRSAPWFEYILLLRRMDSQIDEERLLYRTLSAEGGGGGDDGEFDDGSSPPFRSLTASLGLYHASLALCGSLPPSLLQQHQRFCWASDPLQTNALLEAGKPNVPFPWGQHRLAIDQTPSSSELGIGGGHSFFSNYGAAVKKMLGQRATAPFCVKEEEDFFETAVEHTTDEDHEVKIASEAILETAAIESGLQNSEAHPTTSSLPITTSVTTVSTVKKTIQKVGVWINERHYEKSMREAEAQQQAEHIHKLLDRSLAHNCAALAAKEASPVPTEENQSAKLRAICRNSPQQHSIPRLLAAVLMFAPMPIRPPTSAPSSAMPPPTPPIDKTLPFIESFVASLCGNMTCEDAGCSAADEVLTLPSSARYFGHSNDDNDGQHAFGDDGDGNGEGDHPLLLRSVQQLFADCSAMASQKNCSRHRESTPLKVIDTLLGSRLLTSASATLFAVGNSLSLAIIKALIVRSSASNIQHQIAAAGAMRHWIQGNLTSGRDDIGELKRRLFHCLRCLLKALGLLACDDGDDDEGGKVWEAAQITHNGSSNNDGDDNDSDEEERIVQRIAKACAAASDPLHALRSILHCTTQRPQKNKTLFEEIVAVMLKRFDRHSIDLSQSSIPLFVRHALATAIAARESKLGEGDAKAITSTGVGGSDDASGRRKLHEAFVCRIANRILASTAKALLLPAWYPTRPPPSTLTSRKTTVYEHGLRQRMSGPVHEPLKTIVPLARVAASEKLLRGYVSNATVSRGMIIPRRRRKANSQTSRVLSSHAFVINIKLQFTAFVADLNTLSDTGKNTTAETRGEIVIKPLSSPMNYRQEVMMSASSIHKMNTMNSVGSYSNGIGGSAPSTSTSQWITVHPFRNAVDGFAFGFDPQLSGLSMDDIHMWVAVTPCASYSHSELEALLYKLVATYKASGGSFEGLMLGEGGGEEEDEETGGSGGNDNASRNRGIGAPSLRASSEGIKRIIHTMLAHTPPTAAITADAGAAQSIVEKEHGGFGGGSASEDPLFTLANAELARRYKDCSPDFTAVPPNFIAAALRGGGAREKSSGNTASSSGGGAVVGSAALIPLDLSNPSWVACAFYVVDVRVVHYGTSTVAGEDDDAAANDGGDAPFFEDDVVSDSSAPSSPTDKRGGGSRVISAAATNNKTQPIDITRRMVFFVYDDMATSNAMLKVLSPSYSINAPTSLSSEVKLRSDWMNSEKMKQKLKDAVRVGSASKSAPLQQQQQQQGIAGGQFDADMADVIIIDTNPREKNDDGDVKNQQQKADESNGTNNVWGEQRQVDDIIRQISHSLNTAATPTPTDPSLVPFLNHVMANAIVSRVTPFFLNGMGMGGGSKGRRHEYTQPLLLATQQQQQQQKKIEALRRLLSSSSVSEGSGFDEETFGSKVLLMIQDWNGAATEADDIDEGTGRKINLCDLLPNRFSDYSTTPPFALLDSPLLKKTTEDFEAVAERIIFRAYAPILSSVDVAFPLLVEIMKMEEGVCSNAAPFLGNVEKCAAHSDEDDDDTSPSVGYSQAIADEQSNVIRRVEALLRERVLLKNAVLTPTAVMDDDPIASRFDRQCLLGDVHVVSPSEMLPLASIRDMLEKYLADDDENESENKNSAPRSLCKTKKHFTVLPFRHATDAVATAAATHNRALARSLLLEMTAFLAAINLGASTPSTTGALLGHDNDENVDASLLQPTSSLVAALRERQRKEEEKISSLRRYQKFTIDHSVALFSSEKGDLDAPLYYGSMVSLLKSEGVIDSFTVEEGPRCERSNSRQWSLSSAIVSADRPMRISPFGFTCSSSGGNEEGYFTFPRLYGQPFEVLSKAMSLRDVGREGDGKNHPMIKSQRDLDQISLSLFSLSAKGLVDFKKQHDEEAKHRNAANESTLTQTAVPTSVLNIGGVTSAVIAHFAAFPRMLFATHYKHHHGLIPQNSREIARGFAHIDVLLQRLRFPRLSHIYRASPWEQMSSLVRIDPLTLVREEVARIQFFHKTHRSSKGDAENDESRKHIFSSKAASPSRRNEPPPPSKFPTLPSSLLSDHSDTFVTTAHQLGSLLSALFFALPNNGRGSDLGEGVMADAEKTSDALKNTNASKLSPEVSLGVSDETLKTAAEALKRTAVTQMHLSGYLEIMLIPGVVDSDRAVVDDNTIAHQRPVIFFGQAPSRFVSNLQSPSETVPRNMTVRSITRLVANAGLASSLSRSQVQSGDCDEELSHAASPLLETYNFQSMVQHGPLPTGRYPLAQSGNQSSTSASSRLLKPLNKDTTSLMFDRFEGDSPHVLYRPCNGGLGSSGGWCVLGEPMAQLPNPSANATSANAFQQPPRPLAAVQYVPVRLPKGCNLYKQTSYGQVRRDDVFELFMGRMGKSGDLIEYFKLIVQSVAYRPPSNQTPKENNILLAPLPPDGTFKIIGNAHEPLYMFYTTRRTLRCSIGLWWNACFPLDCCSPMTLGTDPFVRRVVSRYSTTLKGELKNKEATCSHSQILANPLLTTVHLADAEEEAIKRMLLTAAEWIFWLILIRIRFYRGSGKPKTTSFAQLNNEHNNQRFFLDVTSSMEQRDVTIRVWEFTYRQEGASGESNSEPSPDVFTFDPADQSKFYNLENNVTNRMVTMEIKLCSKAFKLVREGIEMGTESVLNPCGVESMNIHSPTPNQPNPNHHSEDEEALEHNLLTTMFGVEKREWFFDRPPSHVGDMLNLFGLCLAKTPNNAAETCGFFPYVVKVTDHREAD